MSDVINLLSDTITKPTDEMRKAMYTAEVGDDVYGHDPTVKKLQQMAAEVVGKEAALFVPSGTMGNLIALLAHVPAGEEVFLEENCHIFKNEAGGIARIAGLMPNPISSKNGILNPDDIRAAIRPKNVHFPKPGLICVENTHNYGGGTVYPLEVLAEIRKIADEYGLKFHMDGARVFNAATYLDVDVKEITKYVDSVMFCLSKGLSAPVGSMLCGSAEFIDRALHARKMVGGGMRQVGVLAAAGIISLQEMPNRLKTDHMLAKKLAEGLSKNKNISIDLENVQTNLIFFDVKGSKDAVAFGNELKEKFNIWCDVKNTSRVRMVTNRHVTEEIVDYVLNAVNTVLI